ncbi:ribonuclease H-like domain-containing protein, partial [Tanacetum coccineum]
MTHPYPKGNFVPKAVLMKSGIKSLNAVGRSFNKSTTNKNNNLKEKVNTVKGDVTTDGPKAVVSNNKGNEANAVKASIMKKLMVDLLHLEEIPKEVESLIKVKSVQLLDENHVLLRVSGKDNMYSVDLKNIVPSGGLTCLFAKDTLDESNLWHRRLGHINFKTLNKLVKGNLVR